MRQACLVPEMSASAKTFCTSSPYRLLARRVVLPWVLQGLRPTGEVLEIGAGSGSMTAGLLARFLDLTVVATDYDPEMVAGASRSISSWSGRVSLWRRLMPPTCHSTMVGFPWSCRARCCTTSSAGSRLYPKRPVY